MATSVQELAIPRWTKRVVTDYSGRDPLGLSRVSQSITDFLLHGIITSTDRARYYSIYCWMLWHIEHHEEPQNYAEYKAAIRRREAALALASLYENPDTSIHGSVATTPELEAGHETGKFYCDFRVLPSNEFGGYGQYYSGSLYELGLTHRDESGVDRVTANVAETLAELVHGGLEATPYIKKGLFKADEISLLDLSQTAPRLTVDAVSRDFARKERNALIDLFFATELPNVSVSATFRRHTLALVLHIVEAYELHGETAYLDEVDWNMVFPPYYYDALWLEDMSAVSYSCPSTFELTKNFWRQFCMHQFFSQAVERLMAALLDVVSFDAMGIPLDHAVDLLNDHQFLNFLETRTRAACNTPAGLFRCYGVHGLPRRSERKKARSRFGLKHHLSEISVLLDKEDPSPQAEAARAMLILASLYAKWRDEADDRAYLEVQQKAGPELCGSHVLPELDIWLDPETHWHECLHSLIERHILNRHDQVMYEKRRLEASWIGRIDGRVRKHQDYGPRFRSSRHQNAVTILVDLGLLHVDDEKRINSTPPGRKLLQRILEAAK